MNTLAILEDVERLMVQQRKTARQAIWTMFGLGVLTGLFLGSAFL